MEKTQGKPKDVVSDDKNWVSRINNEMNSEKIWDHQWGYMTGGKVNDTQVPARASLMKSKHWMEKLKNSRDK